MTEHSTPHDAVAMRANGTRVTESRPELPLESWQPCASRFSPVANVGKCRRSSAAPDTETERSLHGCIARGRIEMTSPVVRTHAAMPPVLAVCAISLMLIILLPIGSWIFPSADLAAQLGREGVFWACAIAVIGFVALVERRPLASIGVRPPRWMSLFLGIGMAAVAVAGMAFIYLVLFPALKLSDAGQTASILSTPLWFRIGLITRAAVFEELFFRGFMVERLNDITRLRWLAASISLVAFTIAHLSGWGWAHLIVAGFGGIVLTGLYLWRGDLWTNIIAHFVTDAIGFLLA